LPHHDLKAFEELMKMIEDNHNYFIIRVYVFVLSISFRMTQATCFLVKCNLWEISSCTQTISWRYNSFFGSVRLV